MGTANFPDNIARMSVTDELRERFVTTFIPKPEAEVIRDQVLDNILLMLVYSERAGRREEDRAHETPL